MQKMRLKNLNPVIAAQLKLILKRDDVRVALRYEAAGVDVYTVTDMAGRQLIKYTNAWDYGLYSIDAMEQNVATIKWIENDNETTNEQKAVFEIFNIISDKYKEQSKAERALAAMSEEEKVLLNKLRQYTIGAKRQK